ncbi:MAG: SDR family NAD(P)-dependent oxidoreductase [Acidimicrobiales bacterium]
MRTPSGLTVITGVTSGFGRAVSQHLARAGHDLVLVTRGSESAALIDDLPGSGQRHVVTADLSSMSDVAAAAEEIAGLGRPIDLLVNNAGAVYGLRRRESVDGIELTMALNHFGYFHLTTALLEPLLEGGGARVVNVASDAYEYAGGRFDFDRWTATGDYRPHRQYGRSKLANILFTHELDRRYRDRGIDTVAWSPNGLTATRFAYGANRLAPALMKLTHPFAAKTEDAVVPLFDLLVDELGARRGQFVCGSELHDVTVCTDADAARLWEMSERVVADRGVVA